MASSMSTEEKHINNVSSFELLGPVQEKLIAPKCVSVASTGEYLVSDSDSCFIIIYNSFGEYLSHFSTIPKSKFYFLMDLDKHRPLDVAWLSSKKVVYTQPWGSKVVVSNWKGKISMCIEGKPLYTPFGVCVDKSDLIYVTDRDKGRILCYSSDGKLIKNLGGVGSNGLNLNHPHFITINSMNDIVLSEINKETICIKVLDIKSGLNKTINTSITIGEMSHPGCVAVDGDNNILHVDIKNKVIHSFSNDVNYDEFRCVKISIGDPYGITLNQQGNLVCIDQQDIRIKIFPLAKTKLYSNGFIKSQSDVDN